MSKRVLSVGQCMPDGMAIASFLGRNFAAHVQTADTGEDALAMLHNGPFDLVLINRVFDADGGSGLDLIKAIKGDAVSGKVPVMLVSNFSDAQQKARNLGAEPGFGKAQLDSPEVVERLGAILRGGEEAT